MSEVRRPPRPAARREQGNAPAASTGATERPRSGSVATGTRPRSTGVPVTAESDELARPWRRDADRRRPARAAEPAAEPARGSRWRGLVKRRTTRGAEAAAEQLGNVTLRLQARLKEQAAAQRRLSAIVWARRAGYVALAGALAWVVLASPVLALDPEQVEVTGYGTVVDPADVAAVVEANEGRSLATLASSRVADELREVPGVRDASVERVWPRGLLIELTSREPVAAVPDGEGGYDLLDSEATRVGRSDATPERLPVVTVPVGKGNERILESVLGVVNQLPVKLRNRVQDISATTEDTVTFVLRNGPQVDWGSAEDSALKARVLQVLLDSGQADDVTEIDVSAPTLPTTTSS
ncbi:cell division protein FtsQ/DivIB [Demequina sp. SYSU T00192]|uniref:Cell division protein FtsQ/DivIB n=1 Tax=Demequina litoralis TaxID=3051660 RepID=A0ABT8GAM5_9MICO|nr:cell division protein FtsQ/DivIB [Demequina sp. SYSU T00192]MDN4476191.1 cell division protein FtsQ/DivIB [Demequina sp. SYSU T00192]